MSDNSLTDGEATAPVTTPQDGPLDDTIGASYNGDQKARLVEAFKQFGWDQSKGIRMVCTAFLESTTVRDAVFRYVVKRSR